MNYLIKWRGLVIPYSSSIGSNYFEVKDLFNIMIQDTLSYSKKKFIATFTL